MLDLAVYLLFSAIKELMITAVGPPEWVNSILSGCCDIDIEHAFGLSYQLYVILANEKGRVCSP